MAPKNENLGSRLVHMEGKLLSDMVDSTREVVSHLAGQEKRATMVTRRNAEFMPTMSQILHDRRQVQDENFREEQDYDRLKKSPADDCKGMSVDDCAMHLDAKTLKHFFKSGLKSNNVALMQQLSSSQAQPKSLTDMENQERYLEKVNRLERKINHLLRSNNKLSIENKSLQHNTLKDSRKLTPKQSLSGLIVDESTQGNPPGIKEEVPATVTLPLPGPRDFNGATAIPARLPASSFGPSQLDSTGVEERGSITVRKSSPYGGIMLRVWGKMNHHLRCELKAYRKLEREFVGNTIYTGYHKEWKGRTTLVTGIIPPGTSSEFDILTCRDLDTGEVQHFRTYPTPPPTYFDEVTRAN
uniref:Uncharacterized protein n=1 Tax=Hanusia phi TaxID=3032 RepID=A0A7S0NEA4_9CRYP